MFVCLFTVYIFCLMSVVFFYFFDAARCALKLEYIVAQTKNLAKWRLQTYFLFFAFFCRFLFFGLLFVVFSVYFVYLFVFNFIYLFFSSSNIEIEPIFLCANEMTRCLDSMAWENYDKCSIFDIVRLKIYWDCVLISFLFFFVVKTMQIIQFSFI